MKIQELGHVVLYVTNLEKSANFYRDILGFRELERQQRVAVYSSGRTHHELLLIEVGGEVESTREVKPGLYHIGFKIGDSPEDAKRAYRELRDNGVTIIGTGDHGVTHSMYILDPDGNELELYADVSDEWKTNAKAILQSTTKLLNLDD